MPSRALLYPEFRDVNYTPQFVGSIYPELQQTQQVLNQRYDLAQDQDSKTAAALQDLMQNTHEKDLGQAQLVYQDYLNKLQERSKSGRFEQMLPQTVQDARKFNVNASKFIAEKQRVDQALKAIDESKDYNASQKAQLKAMTLANQSSLNYDPNTGIVGGSGFREDRFAKDVDLGEKYNKLTEGFIPDQTPITGGKFVEKKLPNGETRQMFLTTNGHERKVTPEDIRQFVRETTKADPEVQGYLDRLTRQQLHQLGEDWRNPNPEIYSQVKQQVEEQNLAPIRSAMANKYGFNQKDIRTNFENDPLDLYKKKLSLKTTPEFDPNPRQVGPSTTLSDFKKVDLTELVKDRAVTTKGGTSQFRGFTGAPSLNTEFIKAKPISELQGEIDPATGLPVYRGLSAITDMMPKEPNESEEDYAKRINPLYNSFLSKIGTRQTNQELYTDPTEAKGYTDAVFGPEIENQESKKKERTGGGLFSNSPVWIESNGKFTKYENGLQALEDGALTEQDLTNFSVTGRNHNYGDFGGSYEAVGKIGNKKAKLIVGASFNDREFTKPLAFAENIIMNGVPDSFGKDGSVTLNGQPIYVEVDPLASASINRKTNEFHDISPSVKVYSLDGQPLYDGSYKGFKEYVTRKNPFKNAIQSKKVDTQGNQTIKDQLDELD